MSHNNNDYGGRAKCITLAQVELGENSKGTLRDADHNRHFQVAVSLGFEVSLGAQLL